MDESLRRFHQTFGAHHRLHRWPRRNALHVGHDVRKRRHVDLVEVGPVQLRERVTVGDGELNEGNNWEAIMLAAKYKLTNMIVFVDRNNIQIDGPTEVVMPLDDLRHKWESFNWYVLEIDGNDIEAVIDAVNMAKAIVEKPVVIIAHTIPGKGVDFMEYDFHWHGVAPNHEQAKSALKQIHTLQGKINQEHD